VPALCDYAVVYAPDDAGELAPLEVTHRHAEGREVLLELQRRFPAREQGARHPAMKAADSGKAWLLPELTQERLCELAPDPEQRGLLQRLGLRSSLVVPLVARGNTLGCLVMGTVEEGRRFGVEHLALARELAQRAATAADNARLYQEAAEANRSKTNFLAVMSHELRTPLTAVIGFTDLLDAGVGGEVTDRQREHLGRIRSSAWHLLTLIEEILAFARVEAGRETVEPEVVDWSALARDAAALMVPVAETKGLALRVALPEGREPGSADAGKVKQVLLNLLSNAVKFTERGEVVLAVEPEPERIRLRVSDTGIGIPAEHLERVFEPFWQVEQPTTRRAGGTGLGLSVTRRLTRLMAGEITVRSTPGAGTEFLVELPRHMAARVAGGRARG
jgi:signal transduction histidine kinase